MRIAKRVSLRCGKVRRVVILEEQPFPAAGDLVQLEGLTWTVVKATNTTVIAKIPVGKVKQVFP